MHTVQTQVVQRSTAYMEVIMEYIYFYFVFFLKEPFGIFKLKVYRDKVVTVIFWKTRMELELANTRKSYHVIIHFYLFYARIIH